MASLFGACFLPSMEHEALRFMVITDNHVGFMESDPVRGKDALVSFEETLQLAASLKVDFILHGGDLFHESRPSRESVYAVMKLLNRYLPTDVKSDLEIMSGPEPSPGRLPVFMVHGNHDEPGGEGNLAAADILEAAGLVSYFGKQPEVDSQLEVRPILLRKGGTRLALFGLGNLKDERLHRSFSAGKVHFFAPEEDGWFNLLTVHQNRYRGNSMGCPAKNCLLESSLPSFLDLVVWGHEHESKPQPQEFVEPGFHVLQPGSSVATSLSAGESLPKHIALVEVLGQRFRVIPLPLLSVRPLIFVDSIKESEDISALIDTLAARGAAEGRRRWAQRQEWLKNSSFGPCSYIQKEEEFSGKPLIRVRIPAGMDRTTNQKFGLQFSDRVGNPDSLLLMTSKQKRAGLAALAGIEIEDGEGSEVAVEDIQDIVFKYMYSEDTNSFLDMFPEPDLNEAVQAFVDRGDPGAIDRYVRQIANSSFKKLEELVRAESREFDKDHVSATVREWLRAKTDEARTARLHSLPAPAIDIVSHPIPPQIESDQDFGFEDDAKSHSKKRAMEPNENNSRVKRINSGRSPVKPKTKGKAWPLASQQSRSIRN